MTLEIVQRSEAPNDAWRNFESLCRAMEARETLRLSKKVDDDTMQPGDDPFPFIMKLTG